MGTREEMIKLARAILAADRAVTQANKVAKIAANKTALARAKAEAQVAYVTAMVANMANH